MTKLLLICLTSGLLSWCIANGIALNAHRLSLVQAPNHRSSHKQPTPTGGGIGFVLVCTAGWLLSLNTSFAMPGLNSTDTGNILQTLITFAFFLAAIGLADDILHLPIKFRFTLQLILCAGFIVFTDYFSLETFSVVSLFWPFFLMVSFIWWVNLYNFMDGIDGLAASQAIFMLSAATTLIFISPLDSQYLAFTSLMLVTASAISGFLASNWPPARVFMGDVGSTWLGFILFGLALTTDHLDRLQLSTWLILGAFFISDATTTLLSRLLRGERWLEAHRSHAYQILAQRWNIHDKSGHRNVTLLILGINFFWLFPLAYLAHRWPNLALVCVIIAYTPLVIGVIKVRSGDPNAKNNAPARR